MYWNKKHKAAKTTAEGNATADKGPDMADLADKLKDVDLSALGMEAPGSVQDLQTLLQQYGSLLTKENRNLLEETVSLLSQGVSGDRLQALKEKVRAAYEKQKA